MRRHSNFCRFSLYPENFLNASSRHIILGIDADWIGNKVMVILILIQDGAEHGSRVASFEKTLQFFVCFICYFVVLRVGCC